LVGFAHDHASNLSGEHNGLGPLIKKNIPYYFMDLKDPCQSLSLTVSKALKILPINITGFIDKIHNHFRSPQRVAYLNELQTENGYLVLSLKQYINTRWLNLCESLERLLLIWDSLLLYMKRNPKLNGLKIVNYDKISKPLEAKMFKLQIICLKGIIGMLNETNIVFQNQSLDIENLKLEIEKIIRNTARFVLAHDCIPKDVSQLKEEEWKKFMNKNLIIYLWNILSTLWELISIIN